MAWKVFLSCFFFFCPLAYILAPCKSLLLPKAKWGAPARIPRHPLLPLATDIINCMLQLSVWVIWFGAPRTLCDSDQCLQLLPQDLAQNKPSVMFAELHETVEFLWKISWHSEWSSGTESEATLICVPAQPEHCLTRCQSYIYCRKWKCQARKSLFSTFDWLSWKRHSTLIHQDFPQEAASLMVGKESRSNCAL